MSTLKAIQHEAKPVTRRLESEKERTNYQSYLWRLWPADGQGQIWRVSLQNAFNDQRWCFANLDDLNRFLRHLTAVNRDIGAEDSEAGMCNGLEWLPRALSILHSCPHCQAQIPPTQQQRFWNSEVSRRSAKRVTRMQFGPPTLLTRRNKTSEFLANAKSVLLPPTDSARHS